MTAKEFMKAVANGDADLVQDVLQGKLWAFQDEARRKSKRQKDLADIARLIEAHPSLASHLPESVRSRIE